MIKLIFLLGRLSRLQPKIGRDVKSHAVENKGTGPKPGQSIEIPMDVLLDVGVLHLMPTCSGGHPYIVSLQIAEWLQPLDILQLSRASKYFRSIFTSRTARCVWKVARRNMHNMPDSSDMTEMQYASLMFDRQCQVGSSLNFRSVCSKFGMYV